MNAERGQLRLQTIAAVVLCLVAAAAVAQETLTEHTVTLQEGVSPATATINDVAWLQGQWGSEAFGGWCEETWSGPTAGSMVGMYRLLNSKGPVFYELMSLSEVDGGVLLRVKHFNPDLTGWEEKDQSLELPLVSFTREILRFRGLTFHRVSADEVKVFLAMRLKDGSYKEETFTYRRQGGDAPAPEPPATGPPATGPPATGPAVPPEQDGLDGQV